MAHVTGFLGFFTGKFSTRALKEAWKVPGAPLPMVIKDVWAKYANRVSGIGRRKATAVATVMLVMDPDVHSNAELFLGLLKALLDMLEVCVRVCGVQRLLTQAIVCASLAYWQAPL